MVKHNYRLVALTKLHMLGLDIGQVLQSSFVSLGGVPVPARYSEGPLFRQELGLGLRLGLGIGLGSGTECG